MKNLSTLFGKDNLDEIVFTNRNKAYGAYALRNEYSNDLTKAVLIGVAFFASVSIIPLLLSAFETKTIISTDDHSGREIIVVDVPDTPVPPVSAVAPTKVKTVASEIFTPVRVVKKDKPAPTEEDKKDAALSSETSAGPETSLTVAPPAIKVGPPTVAPAYTPPAKPAEDPNKLINQNEADVAADFKGGINAFREKVAQNFDTESVQDGLVSAVITFVVEKDGSISNLKINGSNADFNSEAEKAVKSVKTKWTAAQLKGKAVRSSFRMPISMKIE